MERDIGADAHASSRTLAVVGPSGRRLGSHVVETNARALIEGREESGGTDTCAWRRERPRSSCTRCWSRTWSWSWLGCALEIPVIEMAIRSAMRRRAGHQWTGHACHPCGLASAAFDAYRCRGTLRTASGAEADDRPGPWRVRRRLGLGSSDRAPSRGRLSRRRRRERADFARVRRDDDQAARRCAGGSGGSGRSLVRRRGNHRRPRQPPAIGHWTMVSRYLPPPRSVAPLTPSCNGGARQTRLQCVSHHGLHPSSLFGGPS